MKKLITLCVLAIMVTVGAQAASINWDSGRMDAFSGDFPKNSIVTFIIGATPGGFVAALEGGMSLNDALAANSGLIVDGTALIKGAPGYAAKLSAGQAYTTFGANDTPTGFGVVFSADGTKFLHAENIVEGPFNANDDNQLLKLTGLWQQYDVIPEPTSFALLGLGAAVLALRRRRRK